MISALPDACLLDTNVLLRLANRADPEHEVVDQAVAVLLHAETILCFTHQNVSEFWNVATRPEARNGLGLPVDLVESEVAVIERNFLLLPDNERVYREWRRLILAHKVLGIKVHDAKLVASMLVHGVPALLTLNPGDFARFDSVQTLHPSALLP